MIKSAKITNHLGESLTLELKSPEKSGFFVRGIEGLGPTKSNVNLSEALTLDGGYYNSSRGSSRNLVFDIGFYDTPIESPEALRYKTYRFFPMKKPLEIEIQTDGRTGITTGYVETNEPNIFSNEEGSIISIVCPSAYFQSKEYVSTVFSGVVNAFEFPFENTSLTEKTLVFGNVFINTESNVQYTGDVATGVIILISFLGAVYNPIIYNNATGESMAISSPKLIAMTGSGFVAGDTVIISTISGNKYIYLIRNGVYINILNTLAIDTNWFTIERGDNVFTYTASSGLSNMQFLIQHKLIYEGI